MENPSATSLFVGRKSQLADLERYYQEALQGSGRIVFITGEAGIGKTTLVTTFCRQKQQENPALRWAYSRCSQGALPDTPTAAAYEPFKMLLNSLAEQTLAAGEQKKGGIKETLAEFVKDVGPDTLQLIPFVGNYVSVLAKIGVFIQRRSPEQAAASAAQVTQDQTSIFQQFTQSFRNLAAHGPLILIVDDCHWADVTSTHLLFHLASQLSGVPVLLLATYRPETARISNHPILDAHERMQRYCECAEIAVDFLTPEEVESYLHARFPGVTFKSNFVEKLYSFTSGNSLFLSEYVNLLIDQGALSNEGRLLTSLEDLPVPQDVAAVIKARIRFLDNDTRNLLAYASVEGEHFTTAMLRRLAGLETRDLFARLRLAADTHQLILSLGQQSVWNQKTTLYRFVHALVHHTLYNVLEAEERQELHGILLAVGSELYDQAPPEEQARMAPDLLRHAAGAGDHLAQARFALETAQDAARDYAHAEVLLNCELGLQALRDLNSRSPEARHLEAELRLRQGKTYEFTGNWQQARQCYQQAARLAADLKDAATQATAENNLGLLAYKRGDYEAARASLEAAVRLKETLNDPTSLAVSYNNLGLIAAQLGNVSEALEWYQKAAILQQQAGDLGGLAVTLSNLGALHLELESPREAAEWFQRAVDLQQRLHDDAGLAVSSGNLGLAYRALGRYTDAEGWLERAAELCARLGDQSGLAWVWNGLGMVSQDRGETEQAMQWYRQAEGLRRQLGDQAGLAVTLNNMGTLYLRAHQVNQALQCFEECRKIDESLHNKPRLAKTFASLGAAYAHLGKLRQALRHYRKALELYVKQGSLAGQADVCSELGMALHRSGEDTQALTYCFQAMELHQQAGDETGLAHTMTHVGEIYQSLGEYDQALEYYQKAAALLEARGDLRHLAGCYENLGSMYYDAGRLDQAQEWYRKAIQLEEQLEDKASLATLYNNLGLACAEAGGDEEALAWLERSAELKEELCDERGLATRLHNLGILTRRLGRLPEARAHFTRSLDLFRKLGLNGEAENEENELDTTRKLQEDK